MQIERNFFEVRLGSEPECNIRENNGSAKKIRNMALTKKKIIKAILNMSIHCREDNWNSTKWEW